MADRPGELQGRRVNGELFVRAVDLADYMDFFSEGLESLQDRFRLRNVANELRENAGAQKRPVEPAVPAEPVIRPRFDRDMDIEEA